jgi:hypothetical protein
MLTLTCTTISKRQSNWLARGSPIESGGLPTPIRQRVQGDSSYLIKHVDSEPRDVLAVSIAMPTIAFSGAYDVPEDAWEQLDRIAPTFRDDWWFDGLLAFARQECDQLDEARDLALRALAAEPRAGTAAHARAHVHWESGDHEGGLEWLDPWVATDGRDATHLAHFSWHAALHELALDNTDAVIVRYRSQLAPPTVWGPSTAPSLGALAAKIAIGVGLVLIAVRQRRRMGRPKKPKKTPKWQTGIDNMSPWYAIGLAPLTQPWGLVAAGIATITEAKLSTWESYVAVFLFCVVATAAYLAMEIYAGFRLEKSQAFLADLRTWMDTHTDQVIIVVSLVVGFWLIGKSIYLIVT